MTWVDRLMVRWARAEDRRDQCRWCRAPLPADHEQFGRVYRACSNECADELGHLLA